ncbi:MAG: HAD-IIIA family hydrolase [Treponema sp.]|jgi:D,D-heptose 1,7-bisphosphate phosphatase|nr:HAD-IIIA family hydrolase [Treponema sp.]
MKTVIMAGGKGTRIASVAQDIPKPMIPLCGKPILEYQIECLKRNSLTDIIMVVGHLGHIIKEHFGDGSKFGCTVSYYTETEPLGTAGALYKIAEDLSDDFLLIHGDIIFDVDFSRFIEFHREHKAWATLAVHPNSHPYDSALLVTGTDKQVIQWINKEDPRRYYKNQVNAGLHILSKTLLSAVKPSSEKVDLDRDILKPLIHDTESSAGNAGKIYAYPTPEYIKDMGTPDRYAQVSSDIENGMVRRRNLSVKQRAVFLDRDGTINKLNGFVTKPEGFELIDGAAEAIRKINSAGYLAIVITNQPVIARGEASLEDLDLIHRKMETELGKAGAYIDDIFFCPHHPDKGFAGERPEYKIDCECRKPKPGMILQAAGKYNIDLAQSYIVGDDKRDVGAALNAGCKAVLLKETAHEDMNSIGGKKIPVFAALADFVATVIEEKKKG